MADQTFSFSIKCGFFDAISSDRSYTAADMNMPYKRIVTNGVFATPAGSPSTDLQIRSAGDGMRILVSPGMGLFGDRWFENTANVSITVPANNGIVSRVDSVLVQVDKRQSGRVGNIVYRTGTPASNPQPPDINTVTDVAEYRLANITVAPNAAAIYNDVISDQRGSEDCPWVTSLIKQVDTSTLFNQWQTAYSQYYRASTTDFNAYMAQQKQDWEAFVSGLVDDLTAQTELMMLTNISVLSSDTTTVAIGIPAYDYTRDLLQVYVNGKIKSSVDYSISSNHQYLNFYAPVREGDEVYIVVLKSVITGNVQTVTSLISQLDQKINNFMSDSGWVSLYAIDGASAYDSDNAIAVRFVGRRIYLRGAVKGVTSAGGNITSVPANYAPAKPHTFASAAVSGTTVLGPVTIQIRPDGYVKVLAIAGSISSTAMIPINTCYILD